MPSVLAIISKAQFEDLYPRTRLGDRLRIDRYLSRNANLAPLAQGGALFLVTVRPPDEKLWLVAVLEDPRSTAERWEGTATDAPVIDLSAIKSQLKFSTGKGIQAKAGALGMSLQTPRQLTAEDERLLRAAVGSPAPALAPPPADSTAAKAPKAAKPAKPPKPSKAKATLPPPPAAEVPPVEVPPLPTRPPPVQAAKLLQKILADPDDLSTRRIYADVLTEAGDPAGEFIQLSCALEEFAPDDPRRAESARIVDAYRARHGLAWSAPVRQIGPFDRSPGWAAAAPVAFARGFVEVLRGEGAEVVEHLDAAAAVAPIRTLELREVGAADLDRLGRARGLRQIRALNVGVKGRDAAGAQAVLRLLSSAQLGALTRLRLGGELPPALGGALAACPALSGLRELTLDGDAALGPDGLAALAGAPFAQTLTSLTLSRQGLGSKGAVALTRFPSLTSLCIEQDSLGVEAARVVAGLTGLRTLRLAQCELGAKGLAVIAGSGLPALAELDVASNGLNAKGLPTFLDALQLPELRTLGLAGANLRTDGSRLLAECSKLAALTGLELDNNGLKDEGVAALAGADVLSQVQRLHLAGNGIGPAGMAALAEGVLLASVRELTLNNNKCGGEGGKNLARSPHLHQLRTLRLHYNWMGVHGLRAILEQAPGLERLLLGENNFGSEAARFVARSTAMTRLRELRTQDVDSDRVADLARSQAGRRLSTLDLGIAGSLAEDAARALADLPDLETLHLMCFGGFEGAGAAVLRRRFGPSVSFWPDDEARAALPGPGAP